MNWGGWTEKGRVLHAFTNQGRSPCGVTLDTVVGVPPSIMEDMAICKRCKASERGRPVYVYRLNVTYPEGVGPGNPPKDWEPLVIDTEYGPEPQPFSWPTRRHYMSREGAQNRADLLTDWGCTVVIERSEPVTWRDE